MTKNTKTKAYTAHQTQTETMIKNFETSLAEEVALSQRGSISASFTKRFNKLSTASLMRLASYFSVLTALLLIGVKLCAFFVTNSLALLSSLMDSCLDLGASFVSLFAIRQALIPADKDHRFGHGKAEALGGLSQGIIIVASAVFLLFETVDNYLHPKPLQRLDVGLWVMLFSIVMTFLLITFQRYVIRKTNSVSVNADSAHYTGDVLMNVGVIISMIVSYAFGFRWVDSLFALGVSFYLFYTSLHVFKQSLSILMDRELPLSIRRKIKKIAYRHPEIKSIHDLRTRNAGLHSFVQFHIEMKRNLTLEQTHQICDELETEIKEILPDSETFIHPEPLK